MEETVIGTVEVLLLVVGLTAMIKALGLQGRAVVVVAVMIGALLGGASHALEEGVLAGEAAVWVRILVGALWVGVKGLAAAGLVRFGREEVQRAVRGPAILSFPSVQRLLWQAAVDQERRRREQESKSGCDPP